MRVVFGDWLSTNFATFDDELRLQVARFAIHVENYGVKGLKGRNKSSADLTDITKKALSGLNLLKNIVFGIII